MTSLRFQELIFLGLLVCTYGSAAVNDVIHGSAAANDVSLELAAAEAQKLTLLEQSAALLEQLTQVEAKISWLKESSRAAKIHPAMHMVIDEKDFQKPEPGTEAKESAGSTIKRSKSRVTKAWNHVPKDSLQQEASFIDSRTSENTDLESTLDTSAGLHDQNVSAANKNSQKASVPEKSKWKAVPCSGTGPISGVIWDDGAGKGCWQILCKSGTESIDTGSYSCYSCNEEACGQVTDKKNWGSNPPVCLWDSSYRRCVNNPDYR
jgi:hypothetical protein